MNINLQFIYFATSVIHLEENEWKKMIQTNLEKINSKPIGIILLERLKVFMDSGYMITISNVDPKSDSVIYPKIKYESYKSVLIVIPNVPYFINVETKDNNMERMPGFISLAHELIHCLRHFEGITSDNFEEEATIGINNNKTFFYKRNNHTITENSIRKEHNMNKRISYISEELYCYKLQRTYKNASQFSKMDFFY
jgi:hypothetical protein